MTPADSANGKRTTGLEAHYGRRAQTIVNNHRAKVFASGVGDPESSATSAVIGDGEFRQHSETAGEKGRASSTEGSTTDLALANLVVGHDRAALFSSTGVCRRQGCRFAVV